MRAYLKIHAKNKVIPFDHQPLLTGTIHKWLGWNEEHGKLSLYSFSRLDGAKATKTGLSFRDETTFFFSSPDVSLVKKLVTGIQIDPTLFHGLKVSEIILQEDPNLSDRELFYVASPIFLKRRVGDKIDHIVYPDMRANDCLRETLETKMKATEIIDETLEIEFDKNYTKAGTKIVNYKGIFNRASWCHVIIKGKPETKQFAWNVGLGNSTGIGFGAIK